MRLGWLKRIANSQRGITLVEVLVVVAIAGPISYTLTALIYDVFSANSSDTARMSAIHEAESAVHSIIPDAEMAQTISGNLTSVNGLSMAWSNSWTNSTGNATYKIQSGKLIRSYSENGTAPKTTVVAEYINTSPSMTSSSFTNSTFAFKITTTVSGFRPATETRSFTVLRRSTP